MRKLRRDESTEREVLRLGRARARTQRRLAAIDASLTEALRAADKKRVSVTVLSDLSGLSRPTIYDRLK